VKIPTRDSNEDQGHGPPTNFFNFLNDDHDDHNDTTTATLNNDRGNGNGNGNDDQRPTTNDQHHNIDKQTPTTTTLTTRQWPVVRFVGVANPLRPTADRRTPNLYASRHKV